MDCVRGIAAQNQYAALKRNSERLPIQGAFVVRQRDDFIQLRVCSRAISAEDMCKRCLI